MLQRWPIVVQVPGSAGHILWNMWIDLLALFIDSRWRYTSFASLEQKISCFSTDVSHSVIRNCAAKQVKISVKHRTSSNSFCRLNSLIDDMAAQRFRLCMLVQLPALRYYAGGTSGSSMRCTGDIVARRTLARTIPVFTISATCMFLWASTFLACIPGSRRLLAGRS